MKVIGGRARFKAELGAAGAPAVAIGNFDGVHRGHVALVEAAVAAASECGGTPGVLTFDPHPARFFAPALAPPMLCSLPRRLELLEAVGARFAVVEPFDAALAALEPEPFVEEVLVAALGAGHVVVGYDFSFGHGRKGTGAALATLGERHGFGVSIVPPVSANGIVCSSTRVREFLLEGRVEGANLLLGRRYDLTGTVVRGAGRGRGIGVPTANVQLDSELLPRGGVYAAYARRLDAPDVVYKAALNIGTNPTFAPAKGTRPVVTVEAHLLDYAGGDLYGQRVRLELVARLRDELRFASVDELIAQIHADIARTRDMLT